jgi:hypothetical protein
MKLKTSRKLMLIAAVSLLSGSMVVFAATTLFTQSFPGQQFTTASLVPGSTCSGGTLVGPYEPINPTYSNNPSALGYGCGAGGDSAFTVQGTSSIQVTVTPTFSVPTGWSLYAVSTPGWCEVPEPTVSQVVPLTSGSPLTFNGGSSWVYCLTSSSASTFAAFTITWSQ